MASIILPVILGGIRLTISAPDLIFERKPCYKKYQRKLWTMLTIIMAPFYSIVLSIKHYQVELQLENNPNDMTLLSKWEKIHYHRSQNIKLELGMETIFQLTGQFILYLNTVSETKTNDGLNEVFKEDDKLLKVLLQVSLGWSLISCVLAHVKGLSARRIHFPFMSKVMAMCYSLFAVTIRVLSFVMYFGPTFGLFSMLHHLKAEQIQWHPDLKRNFVINGSIQFGNSTLLNWNDIDRWQTDEDDRPIPPSLTLYTIFTLKQYFLIFWIVLVIQTVLVFLIKQNWSKEDFKQLNFLEKVIHVVENCFIPYNVLEWENIKTGISEIHQKKMKSNFIEVVLVMVVNFIVNFILQIPMFILGSIKTFIE